MSFSACTSPRHGYMVSLQPPVCTAFRLGLLISVPLRGTTSYSVETLQYTTQQPHSSTVSSYSASIMLWRLNSHTHQRCHSIVQASCWGASTATLINDVILQCKHHVVVPRRGTLTSNPRLRESSDRSLGLMYAPCMCLGEVHALKDM